MNFSSTVTSFLVLNVSLISFAQAQDWHPPVWGYQIGLTTPSGIVQASGTQAEVTGTVSLVGALTSDFPGINTLSDLLKSDKVEFHAYFPDLSTEVTSQVTLTAISNGFNLNYQTPVLSTDNLNTMIVQITHKSAATRALEQVKANTDQNILSIRHQISALKHSNGDPSVIQGLEAQLAQLKVLRQETIQEIKDSYETISETDFPLQVDNEVAQPSQTFYMINHYLFTIQYDVGSAFQGESVNATGTIEWVPCTAHPEPNSKAQLTASFFWNGNLVNQVGPESINSTDPVSFSYPTGPLSASVLNQFSEMLTGVDPVFIGWKLHTPAMKGQTVTLGSIAFTEPVAAKTIGSLTTSSITEGFNFTCALSTTGNPYCWGDNELGQLGDNFLGQISVSPVNELSPVEVLGVAGSGNLSGIVSVAGGQFHTCFLTSSGNVYCAGYNGFGELGNNSTATSPTPVEVVNPTGSGYLSGIIGISTGAYHTCALSSSGNVYCWGRNLETELGNNSNISESVPVEVLGVGGSGYLSGIVSLVSGFEHNCALSSSGNIYCWGADGYGQLGDGAGYTSLPYPVEVLGVGGFENLSDIINLAAGDNHNCAISLSGNLYCWGNNYSGQIGDGVIQSYVPTPVQVLGVGGVGYLSGVVTVAGGDSSTCAVTSAQNVFCWGTGSFDGTVDLNTGLTPTEVLGVGGFGYLSNIVSIACGHQTNCALSSAGNLYCWGYNAEGQLGIGNAAADSGYDPVLVPAPADGWYTN